MARKQYRCRKCKMKHFAGSKIGRRHKKFAGKAPKKRRVKRRVKRKKPKRRVKRSVKKRKPARRKKRR